MNRPIDRHDPFWMSCFGIAYEALCQRVPVEQKTLAGPLLARKARFLADDCVRARDASDLDDPHDACEGVGCEACFWSGRANATGPLVAPADTSATIPVLAALETVESSGAGSAGGVGYTR